MRGLTLVEVMLATGLLATAILGLMAVFFHQGRAVDQSNSQIAAVGLARAELEAIRAKGHGVIPANATFDGRRPDPQGAGFPPAPYPSTTLNGVNYTVMVTTGPGERPPLKRVTVELFYQGQSVVLQNEFAP